KLALLLRKEGRQPALVAADLQRPAAVEQLVQLGKQVAIPVYAEERADPVKAVRDGLARAREDNRDVVILDTAGRLHVDEALIERAEAAVEEDEQAEMEKRLRAGQFTFDDFLRAQKMLKRMGPFQNVLKLIPGLGKQMGDIDVDDRQLARVEAIVLSMTPRERSLPHVIDGSRRQRIARGSGTTVQQVNQLLDARKQMEKMMKQMKGGKMPSLPGLEAPGAANGARAATAGKTKSKRKKKRKARR